MTQKPTVLILEDQLNWQNLILMLLGEDQYVILQADNLSTAKTFLKKQIIDVSIVDIRLVEGDFSNFDGITFLDELDRYYSDDYGHAIMLSGIATKEHTINTLTRPSGIVLNFFLKESFDSDKFPAEVQRAVRATLRERDEISSSGLSNNFLNAVNIAETAKILLKNKEIENVTASKDLQRVLKNILIRYNPLGELVKMNIEQTDTGNSVIRMLCWSRKSVKALGVVLREKLPETGRLIPESPWSDHIALDTVLDSATQYLEGVAFELPDITFEQFFSAVNLHSRTKKGKKERGGR